MGSLELAEATAEVLEPNEKTLAELAATANREHGLALDAAVAAIDHAIRAGEALLAAKAVVAPGMWLVWLEQNFTGHVSTGHRYMRIAANKDALPEGIGVREARALLRGVPDADGMPWRHSSETRDEARRLRDGGATLSQTAERLGVAKSTVHSWITGDSRRWRAEQAREALRRQEREKAIKRAVRKQGGALAEAYAMVSKLDGVLGQARQEAESKGSRLAINEAHALRDKLMDQIVRALGVS